MAEGRAPTVAVLAAAAIVGVVVAVVAVAVGAVRTGGGGPAPPAERPSEVIRDELRYVALGDSLALGFAAGTAYPDLVADELARRGGRDVDLHVHARVRWTSGDLLAAVRGDARLRQRLREADVVTWNAGGNDLLRLLPRLQSGACGAGSACLAAAVDGLAATMRAIAEEIVALTADGTTLATMELFDPGLPAGPESSPEDVGHALDAANAALRALPARVAPVASAFARGAGGVSPRQAGLVGGDGVHPTAAGQRLLARELVAVLGVTRPGTGEPVG